MKRTLTVVVLSTFVAANISGCAMTDTQKHWAWWGGVTGAAIGAGVGAGGGVAVEAASKNEQARIDSETRIDFRLEKPLEVVLKDSQTNR